MKVIDLWLFLHVKSLPPVKRGMGVGRVKGKQAERRKGWMDFSECTPFVWGSILTLELVNRVQTSTLNIFNIF